MRLFLFILLLGCFAFSHAELGLAKVKGLNVEYEITGQGQPVIFLEAGGSAGLSDWDSVVEGFSKLGTVIRYSRVGNGDSQKLRKNYSSEEYAQEALLLLKELKVDEPVVYVAHSYGAYIARVFAAAYPDKISALMLIEPASEHDVDIMREIDLAQAEKEIAQIKLDDMANGMSNQYLDFWAKRPLPDYPEIPDIPVTVIASVKQYENPAVLFFSDEGREKWGKLHKQWAESFPRGQVVLSNKSYHYLQFDEPEMVIHELQRLIERTPH